MTIQAIRPQTSPAPAATLITLDPQPDASGRVRPGLPVDGRGVLPDPATLSCRLHAAVDRAAGAGLDVELHLDLGVEVLPAPHAKVLACARESAASRGVEIRTVG